MMYLRLISGVGFWMNNSESKAVIKAVFKDGKDFVIIQNNLIPSHQIAGIFNENMGDEFDAKKRGLILHKGNFYTKNELIGASVDRTDSLGNNTSDEDKDKLTLGNDGL